jgi:hypothetical protein
MKKSISLFLLLLYCGNPVNNLNNNYVGKWAVYAINQKNTIDTIPNQDSVHFYDSLSILMYVEFNNNNTCKFIYSNRIVQNANWEIINDSLNINNLLNQNNYLRYKFVEGKYITKFENHTSNPSYLDSLWGINIQFIGQILYLEHFSFNLNQIDLKILLTKT